ncbi:hypothetical protein A2U01_0068345, partial [Trifolium medium]|nr:hypothetical protein [Trifolium medium]
IVRWSLNRNGSNTRRHGDSAKQMQKINGEGEGMSKNLKEEDELVAVLEKRKRLEKRLGS